MYVKAELDRIADLFAECVAVKCSLHLESEHLVARFHAASADGTATLEEIRLERTQDIIDLLRSPWYSVALSTSILQMALATAGTPILTSTMEIWRSCDRMWSGEAPSPHFQ